MTRPWPQHGRDHVNLLVNNAGIAGGGSFLTGDRDEWERVFGVDWFGVYHCSRAFVPLLVAAEEAALVNVSSINGFWASLGPNTTHTAYSTAKFAVKGFTRGPHRRLPPPRTPRQRARRHARPRRHRHRAQLVPGQGPARTPGFTEEDLAEIRAASKRRGREVDHLDDDQLRAEVIELGESYRDNAPLSAAGAATIILDGVRAGNWRILVGEDAERLDEWVRAHPRQAYDPPAEPLPFDVNAMAPEEEPAADV